MKTMRSILSLALVLMLFMGAANADTLWFYQEEIPNKANGRKMQYLYDSACIWGEEWTKLDIKGTLPVYAYPAEDAWRGANGKACVDARSGFTALAWSEDEQWLLIDYETDKGHRVGYIKRQEGMSVPVATLYPLHIPMQLVRNTYITDDPNGIQKSIAQLPQGSVVDVLGYTDAHWAYIETKIDGKKARAFMPIMNLEMPEETENIEITEKLAGTWRFIGGAELLGYGAIFDGKGGVQICDTEDLADDTIDSLIIRKESALLKYRVYENALGEQRYPNCPYVLEIESEEHFSRYGLQLEADETRGEVLSLIIAEGGGGGYERAEEIEIIRE
ncbi:MAG: hypothetical protein II343_07490 [Clostridia bacterium]|nr:hypothetical protein [Clostridia bacterium]